MKCPKCGEESSTDTDCRNCGQKIPASGMEVQFKNFGGSEMLDIRMPIQAALSDQNQEPLSSDADNNQYIEESFWKKRPVIMVFVLSGIIASVLIWYYLLKFLLQF